MDEAITRDDYECNLGLNLNACVYAHLKNYTFSARWTVYENERKYLKLRKAIFVELFCEKNAISCLIGNHEEFVEKQDGIFNAVVAVKEFTKLKASICTWRPLNHTNWN